MENSSETSSDFERIEKIDEYENSCSENGRLSNHPSEPTELSFEKRKCCKTLREIV